MEKKKRDEKIGEIGEIERKIVRGYLYIFIFISLSFSLSLFLSFSLSLFLSFSLSYRKEYVMLDFVRKQTNELFQNKGGVPTVTSLPRVLLSFFPPSLFHHFFLLFSHTPTSPHHHTSTHTYIHTYIHIHRTKCSSAKITPVYSKVLMENHKEIIGLLGQKSLKRFFLSPSLSPVPLPFLTLLSPLSPFIPFSFPLSFPLSSLLFPLFRLGTPFLMFWVFYPGIEVLRFGIFFFFFFFVIVVVY